MAWFHHAVQETSHPLSSSANNLGLDDQACLHSNAHTAILGDLSEGKCQPQVLETTKSNLPSALQDVAFPRMGEYPGSSYLSLRENDGPIPLSYVTLQEQRCVLNWFAAWTQTQREHFLQDLISKAVPRKVSSLLEQFHALKVKDHSPNIFECQLRLWTQWFETWSEEERNAFLASLEEIDSIFVAQFHKNLASTTGMD